MLKCIRNVKQITVGGEYFMGTFGATAFLIIAVEKFVKSLVDMKSVVSDVAGLVKKYL